MIETQYKSYDRLPSSMFRNKSVLIQHRDKIYNDTLLRNSVEKGRAFTFEYGTRGESASSRGVVAEIGKIEENSYRIWTKDDEEFIVSIQADPEPTLKEKISLRLFGSRKNLFGLLGA